MEKNDVMIAFLLGLGAGAALMYFLDPVGGGRRRALVKDKAVGLTNDAREAINAGAEDLSNRAYGLYAETGKAVTGKPVDESGGSTNVDDTNSDETRQQQQQQRAAAR